MSTKTAISITLNTQNLGFVEKIVQERNTTKSEFLDSILDSFRRQYLKRKISEGFATQSKDGVDDVMSDFVDYVEIIDRD